MARPPSQAPVRRAELALTATTPLDAAELIRLIHDVNPSNRAMSASERESRYRLKARIQSLLLRTQGAFIDVVADEADRPGVVSLRHRILNRDAAHAVLTELDNDAREVAIERLACGAGPSRRLASKGPPPGWSRPTVVL